MGCKRDLSNTVGDTVSRSVEQSDKLLIAETAFFEKHKGLGGEATILKSEDKAEGTSTSKVFHINVPTDGIYYLSAWINSPALDEQKTRYMPLGVIVNDEKNEQPFTVAKPGWHSGAYMDEAGNKMGLKLSKGANTISFTCEAPFTPSIDFIKLLRDRSGAEISDEAYTKFLNEVKSNSSYRAAPSSNTDTTSSASASKSMAAMKMMSTASTVSTTSSLSPDDPLYQYSYTLNKSFNYSYYNTVYLTSGKNMSFTSWAGSQLHVLEVFSVNNPESQSWTAASSLVSGSQRGYVAFTVPTTGYYYVKLRSYYGMESGTASLTVYAGSGSTPSYYYDCPVTGWLSFGHGHTNVQELNYFTAYTSSGDPRLWVVDNNGFPGKVCGYNDDYGYNGGDFAWGLNSRVKKNFFRNMQGVIVSAYSSYNPTGVTDLYSGCMNSDITGAFPNLKADDAIMSSAGSYTYNCTAWTGGLTRGWFWGALYQSQSGPMLGMNYGDPQVWSTWDDYFGNNPARYSGATTYTALGADASNGVIAMWALSNGYITHGSIRKPGNDQAHGYDWESKPGPLARTFHPRDALNGYDYGSIVKYYRIDDAYSLAAKNGLTFEQSVAQGLTAVEDVTLDNNEKSKVSIRRTALQNGTKNIGVLYTNWKNKITSAEYKVISNPYKFIDNQEGLALLKYGKSNVEESILYLTDVIFNEDANQEFEKSIAHFMLCEIAKDRYGDLMEHLKKNWKSNSYTKDRKYIAPLPETFTKKYIKAILNQL